MTTKVEISHKTIIFSVAFLASLWVLFQIRDILFLLFISFLLMTALRPLVELLIRFRIPRLLSIIVVYIIVFGFFGASLATAIPSLAVQISRLLQELPTIVARVLPAVGVDISSVTQQITPISENIVKVTVSIFSNIVTLMTVLVFTFYLLLERQYAEKLLTSWMGEDGARRVIEIFRMIESRLGAWVRGEMILMFAIGIFVYFGLSLLHVEFALPLAILAGLLEIVPIIGPIISAVPAVLVALGTSPFLALSVVALYFIVQQVENNLVVPLVMKKSIGLSPLISITALMIGGKLAGITGAMLAVPVLLVMQVLAGYLFFGTEKNK